MATHRPREQRGVRRPRTQAATRRPPRQAPARRVRATPSCGRSAFAESSAASGISTSASVRTLAAGVSEKATNQHADASAPSKPAARLRRHSRSEPMKAGRSRSASQAPSKVDLDRERYDQNGQRADDEVAIARAPRSRRERRSLTSRTARRRQRPPRPSALRPATCRIRDGPDGRQQRRPR